MKTSRYGKSGWRLCSRVLGVIICGPETIVNKHRGDYCLLQSSASVSRVKRPHHIAVRVMSLCVM